MPDFDIVPGKTTWTCTVPRKVGGRKVRKTWKVAAEITAASDEERVFLLRLGDPHAPDDFETTVSESTLRGAGTVASVE